MSLVGSVGGFHFFLGGGGGVGCLVGGVGHYGVCWVGVWGFFLSLQDWVGFFFFVVVFGDQIVCFEWHCWRSGANCVESLHFGGFGGSKLVNCGYFVVYFG